MTQVGSIIFLILTLPIVMWCAWTDLKSMRIPNMANFAIFYVFLLLGVFFMPIETFGIQLLFALGVFVFFFLLNGLGLIGGGDVKLFGAIAPYIVFSELTNYLFILSFLSIGAVIGHKLVPFIPVLGEKTKDWASWKNRKFPFGLPLAMSLPIFLGYYAYTG